MVNTWNSYVRLTDDGRMLVAAGYMNKTEANVAFTPEVLVTLGSSKVAGNNGPGTGFLIEGRRPSSLRVPTSTPSRRPSAGCAPSWPSRSGRRRRRSSSLPKRSPVRDRARRPPRVLAGGRLPRVSAVGAGDHELGKRRLSINGLSLRPPGSAPRNFSPCLHQPCGSSAPEANPCQGRRWMRTRP